MTRQKKTSRSFSEDQRTSMSMSKLARILQSADARTNWKKMVEMLFRTDPHQGRQDEIRKMYSSVSPAIAVSTGESVNLDQFQYILFLMMIISIAEKQTQEVYRQEFSERCDVISKDHQLQDEDYWTDGNVPQEWTDLNKEFEQRSFQVLVETLKEYHEDELAHLVETEGADQLFNLMNNVKAQFLKVLESPASLNQNLAMARKGSLPEMLRPTLISRKG